MSLSLQVTYPGAPPANLTSAFASDVATALAVAYNSTTPTLLPFIQVTSTPPTPTPPTRRRLLDTSLTLTTLILGNISSALPADAAAAADPTAFAATAGALLAGEVANGTFVAASSGATVPVQVVRVVGVNADGSLVRSSSTGLGGDGGGTGR